MVNITLIIFNDHICFPFDTVEVCGVKNSTYVVIIIKKCGIGAKKCLFYILFLLFYIRLIPNHLLLRIVCNFLD